MAARHEASRAGCAGRMKSAASRARRAAGFRMHWRLVAMTTRRTGVQKLSPYNKVRSGAFWLRLPCHKHGHPKCAGELEEGRCGVLGCPDVQ